MNSLDGMVLQGPLTDYLEGEVAIAASDNEDVDTIDLTTTKYAKWIIYVEGSTESQASEIIAVEKSSVVTYTQYGIVGDMIDYDITLSSDGSEITFNIANNDVTNPITIKFKRLITN